MMKGDSSSSSSGVAVADKAIQAEINFLIKEYLDFGHFNLTSAAFESECNSKNQAIHIKAAAQSVKTDLKRNVTGMLTSALKKGQYGEFFSVWDQYIVGKNANNPAKRGSLDCQEMEFNVNIQFAILPYLHAGGSGVVDKAALAQSMEKFKHFLETRGFELCKSEQFLSYYALPYVPDPRKHPSFKELFQKSYQDGFHKKFEAFVGKALSDGSKTPKLIEFFHMVKKTNGGDLLNNNSEKFRQLQVDHRKLIDVTSNLVEVLSNTLITGKPIDAEQFETIVGKFTSIGKAGVASSPTPMPPAAKSTQNLPGASNYNLRPPIAPNYQQPAQQQPRYETPVNMPLPPIVSSATPLPPPLDYPRIRAGLRDVVLSDSSSCRDAAKVLQGLRMLLEALPGKNRRIELEAIFSLDILALRNPQESIARFLGSNSPNRALKEQSIKLINTLALYKAGRDYFSKDTSILEMALNLVKSETSDTKIRQNSLGILQRMSTRRSVQSILIRLSTIETLVNMMSMELDNFSEDSIEYGTALLMNLCLRTAGKRQAAAIADQMLKVLTDLMEYENPQVKTYVNGALYSLLSDAKIKDQAKAVGLHDMLTCFKDSADESFKTQIDYIINQLDANETNEDVPPQDDTVSEDGADVDDFDTDDDENEEPLLMNEENDELIISDNETFGPMFLYGLFSNNNQPSLAPPRFNPVMPVKAVNRPAPRPASRFRPRTPFDQILQSAASPSATPQPADTFVAKQPSVVNPPPPSQKVLSKLTSSDAKVDIEEYNSAFSTRPRVARTPVPRR